MKKIDYKKEYKIFYKPSSKVVEIVNVPKMNFLMIDGEGNPNTSKQFQDAVGALYSIAYALKFMVKKSEMGIDYAVMPLEGLWYVDDMSTFSIDNKDDWKWTLMIMQPEFITKEMFKTALKKVKEKKSLASVSLVRFESYKEGKSAQIMHIGPFSEEGHTVKRIHDFIKENKKKPIGKHHEIYLSDIRRAIPAKWKTIIRQPFKM